MVWSANSNAISVVTVGRVRLMVRRKSSVVGCARVPVPRVRSKTAWATVRAACRMSAGVNAGVGQEGGVGLGAGPGEVAGPERGAGLVVGRADGQDVVEAAVPQERGVQRGDGVGGADEKPPVAVAEPHDGLEQFVDDAHGDGGGEVAGPRDLLHLVDEDQDVVELGDLLEAAAEPVGEPVLQGEPGGEQLHEGPAEPGGDGLREGALAGARGPNRTTACGGSTPCSSAAPGLASGRTIRRSTSCFASAIPASRSQSPAGGTVAPSEERTADPSAVTDWTFS